MADVIEDVPLEKTHKSLIESQENVTETPETGAELAL